MSKDLPYFKFYPSQWMMGDITLQDYKVQGVFVNIAAYYWQKECSLTLAMLKQKFSNASEEIEILKNSGIISHKNQSDFISIKFLNEQNNELTILHEKRVKAGSLGGKAKLKPSLSKAQAKVKHLEEEGDKKKNIDDRKLKFASTLEPFLVKYGKGFLNNFYSYWTEPNTTNTKFRKELEKTWDLKRRLDTWAKNESSFNKNKPSPVLNAVV